MPMDCGKKGVDIKDAILEACERRFRPILLTTLTTFGGLAPMVFETSRQAKFYYANGRIFRFWYFIYYVCLPAYFACIVCGAR